MGLIKKVRLLNGLPEVQGAYIRIENMRGNKQCLELEINTYASKSSCEDRLGVIAPPRMISFIPSVSEDAPNFLKQGYEFIKSFPEFEGAVDD